MLYPKIINIKTTKIVLRILIGIAILIGVGSLLINLLTGTKFMWSYLIIAAILYITIVTGYAVRKNTNIAAHVVLQIVLLSILTVVIDYLAGFRKWSFNFVIPGILTVGNITILFLLLVTRTKYIKYLVYQGILFIISLLPILFYFLKLETEIILIIITEITATLTLLATCLFYGKDLKNEIQRRFNI